MAFKQPKFWYIFLTATPVNFYSMLNVNATQNEIKTTTTFLLNSKPTIPLSSRQPYSEKRISDPSSFTPGGRSYPIPSFFNYRVRPKEQDYE